MRKRPENLQLLEYSDRELLHIVLDMAQQDGWVEAFQVADRVGIDHPHPWRCVLSRFSWLRRYGAMEKETHEALVERAQAGSQRVGALAPRWRLTPAGTALITGQLKAGQEKALEALTDDQFVALTSYLTRKYRETSFTGATLMRREWRYGTSAKWNGRGPS